MAVAPATRRASDRQRPCHPPLALAPRRLYTSPMRNPTSACPRLPDAARGTSPRSTNCPENGPPYPQNGSCWTRRIVSAADGFEADSFPKKEKLGGGTNRRSSPRPQGPPREGRPLPGVTTAIPAPTPATAARTCAAPTRRRPGTPTPHKPRRRCQGGSPAKEQSTRKAMPKLPGVSTKQTINPLCTFQVQKPQKKGQTIHRTITIKQPAAGGDPLRRRRTGATPSLCGALQCPKPHPRDTGSPWSTMETLAQPSFPHPPAVIPAPTHRHPSTLPCMAVAPATGNPGRRGSAGHPPHPLPPQSRRAATASDRECDVMGPTR